MSNTVKSQDAKALIKAAKLPEKAVEICLAGDLLAEIQQLERTLAKQVEDKRTNGRMVDKSTETAKQIEALREKMAESTITVRLRALPRKKWRALLDEHPPRKGDDGDESMGVNVDTFLEAVLPMSVVDPELDADDWDSLSEAITSAEWDKLTTTVWLLNRTGVDIPKSQLASLTIRKSAGDSK
jgi:hypothetical protein